MTTELDHMEELDKDGCWQRGGKPGCCGSVGRRGEVETASMNNAKEDWKSEGKQRDKTMGKTR